MTEDMSFDEVCCRRHVNELHKLSDDLLPSVSKMFITSTGYLERGIAPNFKRFRQEAMELLS